MTIKKDKETSCIVICRGSSVNRLNEIKDREYEKCYLVNEWSQEIKKHSEIKSFLKESKRINSCN